MPAPKVSVLLPAYNHAHYLRASILSVLEQSYTDFELIVVDDGSTDETEAVVGTFTDARLHYLYQENRGVPGALNTAFLASQGEYIALMNDDDLWLPGKLAEQVEVLDEQKETGLVYSRARMIDSLGNPLPLLLSLPGKYPDDMLKSLLYEDCICPVTAVMRRSCLEKAGLWDESLPGVDDWDLWLRIAGRCGIQFMDRVLASYRAHETNYSGAGSPHFAAYQERRVRVLDKFFGDSALPGPVKALKPLAYRNIYTVIGLQWASLGHWKPAFNCFNKAFRAMPSPVTLGRIAFSLSLHSLRRRKLTAQLAAAYIDWRDKRRAAYYHQNVGKTTDG